MGSSEASCTDEDFKRHELYSQRLAVVHGLESLDVEALAVERDTVNELLRQGFEFGLSERVRSSLPVPWQLPGWSIADGCIPGSAIAAGNGEWQREDDGSTGSASN